jgi:hypothetical protein
VSTFPGTIDNVLNEGLVNFYSGQAELMLSQFENVNHLLGPTHDWTAPGTLCEELLRNFLRQTLPPHMGIDKGFIYGRTEIQGKQTHCPEIDLLIHDNQRYQTVFRMGDFVIVKPQAVLGLLQVKRTLTATELADGLNNVVRAKQLLVNLLSVPGTHPVMPRVFSGVIAFGNRMGQKLSKYQSKVYDCYKKYREHDRVYKSAASLYVMPDFIGSLSNLYCLSPRTPVENVHYATYKTWVTNGRTRKNLALQALLAAIINVELDRGRHPPLAFPLEMERTGQFSALETPEQLAEHQSWKRTLYPPQAKDDK